MFFRALSVGEMWVKCGWFVGRVWGECGWSVGVGKLWVMISPQREHARSPASCWLLPPCLPSFGPGAVHRCRLLPHVQGQPIGNRRDGCCWWLQASVFLHTVLDCLATPAGTQKMCRKFECATLVVVCEYIHSMQVKRSLPRNFYMPKGAVWLAIVRVSWRDIFLGDSPWEY